MNQGTRWVLLMQKDRHQKSHAWAPLRPGVYCLSPSFWSAASVTSGGKFREFLSQCSETSTSVMMSGDPPERLCVESTTARLVQGTPSEGVRTLWPKRSS